MDAETIKNIAVIALVVSAAVAVVRGSRVHRLDPKGIQAVLDAKAKTIKTEAKK